MCLSPNASVGFDSQLINFLLISAGLRTTRLHCLRLVSKERARLYGGETEVEKTTESKANPGAVWTQFERREREREREMEAERQVLLHGG